MRKLEYIIKGKGTINGYTLVQRKAIWCGFIYAKMLGTKIISYEVFESKIAAPQTRFGRDFEEREVYPGDTAFGIWAWDCSTFERAEEILKRIELRVALRTKEVA